MISANTVEHLSMLASFSTITESPCAPPAMQKEQVQPAGADILQEQLQPAGEIQQLQPAEFQELQPAGVQHLQHAEDQQLEHAEDQQLQPAGNAEQEQSQPHASNQFGEQQEPLLFAAPHNWFSTSLGVLNGHDGEDPYVELPKLRAENEMLRNDLETLRHCKLGET